MHEKEGAIMGDTEINLIVGEMRAGFCDIKNDIRASREERQIQMESVHKRISEIAEHGCAHREQHEKDIQEMKMQLATRSISNESSTGTSFFGSFKTQKWQATGFAAVIVAVAIGYAIAKTCNWL